MASVAGSTRSKQTRLRKSVFLALAEEGQRQPNEAAAKAFHLPLGVALGQHAAWRSIWAPTSPPAPIPRQPGRNRGRIQVGLRCDSSDDVKRSLSARVKTRHNKVQEIVHEDQCESCFDRCEPDFSKICTWEELCERAGSDQMWHGRVVQARSARQSGDTSSKEEAVVKVSSKVRLFKGIQTLTTADLKGELGEEPLPSRFSCPTLVAKAPGAEKEETWHIVAAEEASQRVIGQMDIDITCKHAENLLSLDKNTLEEQANLIFNRTLLKSQEQERWLEFGAKLSTLDETKALHERRR